MNPKQTNKTDRSLHQRILEHLATLRLPISSDQLDALFAEAERDQLGRLPFLERVLAAPAAVRLERGVTRRIKNARFRDPGTLESFDWQFNAKTLPRANFEELATGDFVRRRDNLAFVGSSGLGKSHLIQGIGRRCCALGYRVRYVTSAELLEDLTAALGDKTLPHRVRYWTRPELLIIDELGYDKLERREYPEAPSLLYKVVDARNQRASTALVTNIDFKDWTDYFGDPPLAMALLDRVVDTAIIERFRGKSYRAHRAKPRSKDDAQ